MANYLHLENDYLKWAYHGIHSEVVIQASLLPPSEIEQRGVPWGSTCTWCKGWALHVQQSNMERKSTTSRGTGRRCFHCNEEGHIARNCPKKASQQQQQLCYNCGKAGHIKRDCPSLMPPRRDVRDNGRPHVHENGGVPVSYKQAHRPSGASPQGHIARGFSPRQAETGTNDGAVVREWEHRRTSPHHAGNKVESPQSSVHRYSRPPQSGNQERKEPPVHSIPFIDTHCHLEYVFEQSRHQGSFCSFMEKQGYPGNFEGCISTFCDPTAFSSSFGIWEELLSESKVWGTFGIHPHNAKYYYSGDLEDKVLRCIEHPKCVAFGEIGLDYAEHSPSGSPMQKEVLVQQLGLAVSYGKPLLLHCRDAEDDLLQILSTHVPRDWKIHLHCFTGHPDMAAKFMSEFPNLYIGVCGNVTSAKGQHVKQVAREIPLDRLLLETDAPYHVPSNVPKAHQLKFNHPALAFYVAKEIAKLQNVPISEVLQSVRKNTNTLYGI